MLLSPWPVDKWKSPSGPFSSAFLSSPTLIRCQATSFQLHGAVWFCLFVPQPWVWTVGGCIFYPGWLVSWPFSLFSIEAEQGQFNACFSSLLQRIRKLAQKISSFALIGQKYPGLCRHPHYCSRCPLPAIPWSWSLDNSIITRRPGCQSLFNKGCACTRKTVAAATLLSKQIWLFWQCWEHKVKESRDILYWLKVKTSGVQGSAEV